MRFKLYEYDGSLNFKFTPSFESMHLLKSYKTNRQTFSIVECLSTNLENSSIKAVISNITVISNTSTTSTTITTTTTTELCNI